MTEHEEDETILWTLTFRPGRWVLVIIVRDETGAIIEEYPQSGGWEQSEAHITKIYHDDENDDAIAMVAKRYTLTDDTLTVVVVGRQRGGRGGFDHDPSDGRGDSDDAGR